MNICHNWCLGPCTGISPTQALGGVTDCHCGGGETEAESKHCLPVPTEELWVTHHFCLYCQNWQFCRAAHLLNLVVSTLKAKD